MRCPQRIGEYLLGGVLLPFLCIRCAFPVRAECSPDECTFDVSRVVTFFYLRAVVLLTEVVAPPFGTFLMEKYSIWTPLLLALPALGLGFLFILVMPPLPVRQPPAYPDGESEDGPLSRDDVSASKETGVQAFARKSLREGYHTVRETGQVVFSNRVVACSVLAFTVSKFGREMVDFLPQYTSKRLGWSFAKVSVQVCPTVLGTSSYNDVVLDFIPSFPQGVGQHYSFRPRPTWPDALSIPCTVLSTCEDRSVDYTRQYSPVGAGCNPDGLRQ